MTERRTPSSPKMLLIVLPIAVVMAAAIAAINGQQVLALVGVVVAVAAWFVVTRLQRTDGEPPPELTPQESAELRDEREHRGEVAAVRRLRARYPRLSLVQAVHLVRAL